MKDGDFKKHPVQYPPGSVSGPWGVRSVGMYWYVVNLTTDEAVQVSVIGHKNAHTMAVQEAERRNSPYRIKPDKPDKPGKPEDVPTPPTPPTPPDKPTAPSVARGVASPPKT